MDGRKGNIKMTGAGIVALFVKMVPYVVGMRVVTGFVDVGVHWAKLKISKSYQ